MLLARLPLPAWADELPRGWLRPGSVDVTLLDEARQQEVIAALAPLVAPAAPTEPANLHGVVHGVRCFGADWHNDIASGYGVVLGVLWVVESVGMGTTRDGPSRRADERGDVLLLDQGAMHACLPPGWPRLNADSSPHCGHWSAIIMCVERHPDLLARLSGR